MYHRYLSFKKEIDKHQVRPNLLQRKQVYVSIVPCLQTPEFPLEPLDFPALWGDGTLNLQNVEKEICALQMMTANSMLRENWGERNHIAQVATHDDHKTQL